MRKRDLIILCIIMASLTGCSKKESTEETTAPTAPTVAETTAASVPTEAATTVATTTEAATTETIAPVQSDVVVKLSELPDALKNVVYNNGNFYNTDSKSDQNLSTINTFNNSASCEGTLVWKKYIVRDIDTDGTCELIAQLDRADGSDENIVIFDSQTDKVYEYQLGYRSAIKLYDDNVIMGSSGAAYSTFYTLKFDKEKSIQTFVAESSGDMDANGNATVFTVKGQKVSMDEYYKFIDTYKNIIQMQWSYEDLTNINNK